MILHRWPSLVDCESGSELIEFALAVPVLLLVIFGIMDCSRAMYSYHYCAQVAREATRYSAVRGSTWAGQSCLTVSSYACMATASDVTNFVSSITPMGFSAANLVVTTTWSGLEANGTDCSTTNVNNSPGCIVTVKVAYVFSYALPLLPTAPLNLSSTSNLTITQ